ncbi:MAG: glutathione S-transferase family protein [Gammaproteobacteria bacterium]|nr:glutathione S-transferase family protein [Gammaproteobacteria bacterium]
MMKLVLGNKNYSSWSLRPWVLLKTAGYSFTEVNIPLDTPKGVAMLEEYCPAKKVPVLYDGPLVLWDSLAICEYVADKAPDAKLWPEDVRKRAEARSISSEMHSGFSVMRSAMPMNCRRKINGFKPSTECQIDINRIVQLWEQALNDSGGPWLFGSYSVADAMYAPVVSRFKTYQIGVPPLSAAYMQTVLDSDAIQQWYAEASRETEIIQSEEVDP